MEWTKDIVEEFIELYRSRPSLWQVKDSSYVNKKLKRRAYGDLTDFLKTKGFSEVDEKFVKSKIQNIRNAFRKETKKIESSTLSGKGADEVYIPKLWYYNLLMFTKDQDSLQTSVDNLCSPAPEDTEGINEDSEDRDESTVSPQSSEVFKLPSCTPRSKKRKGVDTNVSDFMKICTETFMSQEKPDELDAVGINFAAKLRKMTNTQQILAEALMHKVVTMGLLNKLMDSTDIVKKASRIFTLLPALDREFKPFMTFTFLSCTTSSSIIIPDLHFK